jgi:hypothetical protein
MNAHWKNQERPQFARPLLVLSALLCCCPMWSLLAHPGHHEESEPELESYELVNGLWFDGEGFRAKTFYAVSGLLTEKKPPLIDARVDLEGGYVVPPFGEAHNHNVVQLNHLEQKIHEYLSAGVYYVKIANSVRDYTAKIRDKLNKPQSLGVVFANGGLTASSGHPVKLYEDQLREHMYSGTERFSLNNRAYFIIDNESDLEEKWPMIRATPPDFIKTFLYYSEEYEKRRDDPAYSGRKGLNPKLLPVIVEKAHAEGLRVATHIETAADFHNALAAGVDEVAHLPGYNIPAEYDVASFQISEEDAEAAAAAGLVVVTTTILSEFKVKDPERLQLVQANQVRNLRLLHDHGVAIAIGSDRFELTSVDEAMYLHKIGAFDNLTLLKYWSETTAHAIFPERHIGRLAEGYEASFLVLGGNPVEDFKYVKEIHSGFQQGMPLEMWDHHRHHD